MPGTITFKPIEANLIRSTDLIGTMNPYCSISVGQTKFNGHICKKGGKHPQWMDTIQVPIKGTEPTAVIEVMDKDRLTKDDTIGGLTLNLQQVQAQGQMSGWFPIFHKNTKAGEILLECTYQDGSAMTGLSSNGSRTQQGQFARQREMLATQCGAHGTQVTSTSDVVLPGAISQQKVFSSSPNQSMTMNNQASTIQAPTIQASTIQASTHQHMNAGSQYFVDQSCGPTSQAGVSFGHHHEQERLSGVTADSSRHVYTEQHQVVNSHAFSKNVAVTEVVPTLREVDVYEAQTVLREVQYTEAVPVKKLIEVSEPVVVIKEIEVMEPVLVNKTIECIEHVPVKKMVEVVEMVNSVQDVETYEPQTFTTTVEITEQVPVKKLVEVTEAVHCQRQVEFVEPVITTEKIVKEVIEPVIVEERITREVGPATLVGVRTDIQYGVEATLNTEERRLREMRLIEERGFVNQQGIAVENQSLTRGGRTLETANLGYANEGNWTAKTESWVENRISGFGTNKIQPKEGDF